MMRIAVAAGLFVAVLAAGTLAFIYSGVYDIAATTPHFGITQRLLRITMFFRLKDNSLADQVKAGDRVEFSLEKSASGYVISGFQKP